MLLSFTQEYRSSQRRREAQGDGAQHRHGDAPRLRWPQRADRGAGGRAGRRRHRAPRRGRHGARRICACSARRTCSSARPSSPANRCRWRSRAPCAHARCRRRQHDNPLDLPTVCYMGTNVISGTATAVVVATGARTYLGSLAHSMSGQRVQTSFDRGVNSVSWLLIRFMAVMVPVVFAINWLDKGSFLAGVPVRAVGRGRPDAGDAAADRHRQPGQGRDGDVAAQGGGEAAQRDPELRRDGCAVHRQDRHADAGQDRAGAAPRPATARNPTRRWNTATSTAASRPA